MLGNFSKRGTGAGFHLTDEDRAASLGAQADGEFSSHCYLRLRGRLMGRVREGRDAYAAAVDGQKQERQRAVISHQGSESRHIQAKVLWDK